MSWEDEALTLGPQNFRDMVEVAPQTEEAEGRGLSPETLLERLGFPRSQQHKEVTHSAFGRVNSARCCVMSAHPSALQPMHAHGSANPRLAHVQIGLLSGGQRRRLQLAAVLRRRPNMLLLDEVQAQQALQSSTA